MFRLQFPGMRDLACAHPARHRTESLPGLIKKALSIANLSLRFRVPKTREIRQGPKQGGDISTTLNPENDQQDIQPFSFLLKP